MEAVPNLTSLPWVVRGLEVPSLPLFCDLRADLNPSLVFSKLAEEEDKLPLDCDPGRENPVMGLPLLNIGRIFASPLTPAFAQQNK